MCQPSEIIIIHAFHIHSYGTAKTFHIGGQYRCYDIVRVVFDFYSFSYLIEAPEFASPSAVYPRHPTLTGRYLTTMS